MELTMNGLIEEVLKGYPKGMVRDSRTRVTKAGGYTFVFIDKRLVRTIDDETLEVKDYKQRPRPICPKCLSAAQVWRERANGKWRCHRYGCGASVIIMEIKKEVTHGN